MYNETILKFMDGISIGADFIPVTDEKTMIINGCLYLVLWVMVILSMEFCIKMHIDEVKTARAKKIKARKRLQAKKIQLKKQGLL